MNSNTYTAVACIIPRLGDRCEPASHQYTTKEIDYFNETAHSPCPPTVRLRHNYNDTPVGTVRSVWHALNADGQTRSAWIQLEITDKSIYQDMQTGIFDSVSFDGVVLPQASVMTGIALCLPGDSYFPEAKLYKGLPRIPFSKVPTNHLTKMAAPGTDAESARAEAAQRHPSFQEYAELKGSLTSDLPQHVRKLTEGRLKELTETISRDLDAPPKTEEPAADNGAMGDEADLNEFLQTLTKPVMDQFQRAVVAYSKKAHGGRRAKPANPADDFRRAAEPQAKRSQVASSQRACGLSDEILRVGTDGGF